MMTSDYLEVFGKGSQEDGKYSAANRVPVLEILRNPTNYSEYDMINTLVSFHEDICANVVLGLYPSMDDAAQDLEILKGFQAVLDDLYSKDQRTVNYASYQRLRAEEQLLQMKAAMAAYLKSDEALLLDGDTRAWMLQKSQCNEFDTFDDFEYDDVERHLKDVQREKCNVVANLQRLEFDMSKLQDCGDADQYDLKFTNNQHTRDHYELLEKKWIEMLKGLKSGHYFGYYSSWLKLQIETLEKDFKSEMDRREPVKKMTLSSLSNNPYCRQASSSDEEGTFLTYLLI